MMILQNHHLTWLKKKNSAAQLSVVRGKNPTVPVKLSAEYGWDSAILDRLAREIHSGKLKAGNIDPELFAWTRDQLLNAITEGMGSLEMFDPGTPDFNLLVNLHNNVQVFSGFKTHEQLRKATDLLTDKDGKIKPWTEFRNDITALDSQYNINYLQAEYNTAVTSAQMASRWQDIERDAEILPMLTFRTSEGESVCPTCAGYNGITKPVSDPFWNDKYPPLHFGCHCDVDQSADAIETDTEGSTLPEVPKMFDHNAGKSGRVFSSNHSYFQVSRQEKKQVHEFLKLHETEAVKLQQSWNQYTSYSPQHYFKEGFDKKSGGFVVRNKKHKGGEVTNNLITSRHLMKRGEKIELVPVKNIENVKGNDAIRNGVNWEFKVISEGKSLTNPIVHHFGRAKGQAENLLIRIDQPIDANQLAIGLKEGVRKDTKNYFRQIEIIWLDNNKLQSVAMSTEQIRKMSTNELALKMKSE